MAGNDLFNPGETKDDLFQGGTPSPEPDKKYLEDLVGEGRKYADAEALAKAKMHADAHIAQVERDNEELRQELQKRLGVEEFYERLQRERQTTPTPSIPESHSRGEEESRQPEISLNDVKSLIQDAMSEFVSTTKQKENKDYVMSELRNRLGDNFQVEMHKRAQALGESTEDLTKLAMSKPKVFLELMAPGTKSPRPQSQTSIPPTQRNSTFEQPMSGVRNQSYYDNLKRSDPQTYFSKKTRVQMMNDAVALGEAFFN